MVIRPGVNFDDFCHPQVSAEQGKLSPRFRVASLIVAPLVVDPFVVDPFVVDPFAAAPFLAA